MAPQSGALVRLVKTSFLAIWICDEGDGNAIQTSVQIFPSILFHYGFDRSKLLHGDLKKQTNIPT